ncbi:TIGR03084 family metal-binding protein [Streptomyces sp. NPDC051677]|uniref:TIGR03084 family metal-binding protein n=1 Tax=Streptomyces sp. NPDC051677 TaxID=3365669 RepID=UPI0037CE81F8
MTAGATKLDEVLTDLEAESNQLDALVASLAADDWRMSTPAETWTIAHQIAHLASTDEAAVLAATDKQGWDGLVRQVGMDPSGFVDSAAASLVAAPPGDLLAAWRASRKRLHSALREFPAGRKLPWFGPPMSPTSMATARFMETWAHGLDIAEALDAVSEPTDPVRHVVHLGVRTRGFTFASRGLPLPTEDVYVHVTLPSGMVWEDGSPDAKNSIRGSAYHFALCVTQRRHRDDLDLLATGEVADQWLDIAQAFAGPPGRGRRPAP